MRYLSKDDGKRRLAQVVVNGTVLVCRQTPAGTWVCCAEHEALNCACGFTVESAAANWVKAQQLLE